MIFAFLPTLFGFRLPRLVMVAFLAACKFWVKPRWKSMV